MLYGVYLITFKKTGDTYVGSTVDISKRWTKWMGIVNKTHKPPKGSSKKMLKAIEGNSVNDLRFDILEITDHLREREAKWIEVLNPTLNTTNPSMTVYLDDARQKELKDECYELSCWWAMLTHYSKARARSLYEVDEERLLNEIRAQMEARRKSLP